MVKAALVTPLGRSAYSVGAKRSLIQTKLSKGRKRRKSFFSLFQTDSGQEAARKMGKGKAGLL